MKSSLTADFWAKLSVYHVFRPRAWGMMVGLAKSVFDKFVSPTCVGNLVLQPDSGQYKPFQKELESYGLNLGFNNFDKCMIGLLFERNTETLNPLQSITSRSTTIVSTSSLIVSSCI